MRLSQTTGAFIALLLIFSCNTYGMEPETKPSSWLTWLGSEILGVTIHGGATSTVNKATSSTANEITSYAGTGFDDLPTDVKTIILSYLSMGANATSVEEAGKAIKSLSLVNNELNQFINNPDFCLQTIKYLAKKFNCTDETAAQALGTTEAQRRLVIQKGAIASIKKALEGLPEELLPQEIDICFTYNYANQVVKGKGGMILLRYAFYTPNFIHKLNDSNINFITNLIERSKDLINYKPNGITALHFLLTRISNAQRTHHEPEYKYILKIIEALLNAGADPEFKSGNSFITANDMAELIGNQKIIDLITNAIKQKHNNKEQG